MGRLAHFFWSQQASATRSDGGKLPDPLRPKAAATSPDESEGVRFRLRRKRSNIDPYHLGYRQDAFLRATGDYIGILASNQTPDPVWDALLRL